MSRELDAQVATVLGYEQMPSPAIGWGQRPGLNGAEMLYYLPRYSEDFVLAWGLIQMARQGYGGHHPAVIELTFDDSGLPLNCSACIHGPGLAERHAWADEMPEAICRAFVEAYG